ncbi:hypothetical protein KFK09_018215 [Dendrobium nobile]|uniref:Uncharacterized protein n=1 Tax=Dendrobium nobile TaxID=94219 RepID=A0A8T3AV80_DENNO|nr:hypothetical protein KFK09_018215 [Dendrobium nobile]
MWRRRVNYKCNLIGGKLLRAASGFVRRRIRTRHITRGPVHLGDVTRSDSPTDGPDTAHNNLSSLTLISLRVNVVVTLQPSPKERELVFCHYGLWIWIPFSEFCSHAYSAFMSVFIHCLLIGFGPRNMWMLFVQAGRKNTCL